jgi:hypothetical protein
MSIASNDPSLPELPQPNTPNKPILLGGLFTSVLQVPSPVESISRGHEVAGFPVYFVIDNASAIYRATGADV